MEITRDFILAEIATLEQKDNEARNYLKLSEGAMAVYKLMLERLEKEAKETKQENDGHLS